jgi:hypothetical protein
MDFKPQSVRGLFNTILKTWFLTCLGGWLLHNAADPGVTPHLPTRPPPAP